MTTTPTADLSGFDTETIDRAQRAVTEYVQWIADTGGDDTGKLSLFAQDALVHQFAYYLTRPANEQAGRTTTVAREAMPGVRVKPLEWRNLGGVWLSTNGLIEYRLSQPVNADVWRWSLDRIGPFSAPHATLDAAKAAAQADYERHILRAIDVAPAAEPVVAVNWPEWATDKHIAEGIIAEAETIVSLVVHGHEEEIAEHTGAIKSFAGTLLTRENHRAKYTVAAHPPLPATNSPEIPDSSIAPAAEPVREPIELWLKVHNLRKAAHHPVLADRKRIVAAYMQDFTADDILTLQEFADAHPPVAPAADRNAVLRELCEFIWAGDWDQPSMPPELTEKTALYAWGYSQSATLSTLIEALKARYAAPQGAALQEGTVSEKLRKGLQQAADSHFSRPPDLRAALAERKP